MNRRWVWFSVCVIAGLMMLGAGLLVPVHLRAVDVSIIEKAGGKTPDLIDRGLALAQRGEWGAAQLLAQAAQDEGLPGREPLDLAVRNLAREHPDWLVWGRPEPRLEPLFTADNGTTNSGPVPFTDFVLNEANHDRALELLGTSRSPSVQSLLRCRELTNTVIFSPSQSASGQAFDAALSVSGLLLAEGRVTTGVSNAVLLAASEAERGHDSLPLEQVMLDLMSLGQRLNWGQLVAFVGRIEDARTLRVLANLIRHGNCDVPALFSAVELSGRPADVGNYLMNFGDTGPKDLRLSLRYGAGGVDELLRSNQPLHASSFRERMAGHGLTGAIFNFTSDYGWRNPGAALAVKWFCYLMAGFLLALALHFARPAVSFLEQPLQVRGFHVAREILFALGFLFVVLLVSEPFLARDDQKVELPLQLRLRLPTAGGAGPVGTAGPNSRLLNHMNLMILLLFFVLQGLIYIACLVKLAEIRRQQVPSRVKLKLLENEEHLFDAGLYLGFACTIICLILVSMKVFSFTLMTAYSSTSFGIVFVSVFKIFQLRPARRVLLLEAEASPAAPNPPAAPAAPVAVPAAPTFATPS